MGVMSTNKIIEPWIKLSEYLSQDDYDRIHELQEKCQIEEQIAFKLELDYKLAVAAESRLKAGSKEMNEFLYYDGTRLFGYIGICGFGGAGMPLEITGMVDPEYRRQGIFTKLSDLVLQECRQRGVGTVLLLCDRKATIGQQVIKKINADYKHTEYEMYLKEDYGKPKEELYCGLHLRRATNADAYEIARQNAIYFGDVFPEEDGKVIEANQNISKQVPEEDLLCPEEEEKRGITIYLAYKDQQIIGKVHLDSNSSVGGIYGLGVLPEYRGRGYGRALLLRAIEKLKEERESILLQVEANNSKALGLYQSCGFYETSIMDYYELKP